MPAVRSAVSHTSHNKRDEKKQGLSPEVRKAEVRSEVRSESTGFLAAKIKAKAESLVATKQVATQVATETAITERQLIEAGAAEDIAARL